MKTFKVTLEITCPNTMTESYLKDVVEEHIGEGQHTLENCRAGYSNPMKVWRVKKVKEKIKNETHTD